MRKKINLQFMTIAVIGIITTLLIAAGVCRNFIWEQIFDDLRTYGNLLTESRTADEMKAMEEILGEARLQVTWLDAGGGLLYESGVLPEDSIRTDQEKEEVLLQEIREARETGEGKIIRSTSRIHRSMFVYAMRLEDGSILRVAKEADNMIGILKEGLPAILGTLCLLLLLCFAIACFFSNKLLQPIREIVDDLYQLRDPDTYEELAPFVATIKRQHEDILRGVRMRQEFTANVSHELKTPLTAISGYSELIENGMATDADVVRFAREIHRNSDRLLTLINDTIRLSELDTVENTEHFEEIDLYEIASACVNMLQVSAEKNQVYLSLKGSSCLVYSEKQMLEELVYNLCDNAIRYNNKEGMVSVTAEPQGEQVVLMVEDTGIGIPEEHQERIFERFYRVDKSRSKSTGGTGLGLAIVKHIVARHQAELSLESRAGEGTRIRVVFRGIHGSSI